MQQSIFLQKFKKVCVLQRRACNNFKRNYLENYNDSEHVVKTKNAPFFTIFPNISFFHMVVNYWTGPLRGPGPIGLLGTPGAVACRSSYPGIFWRTRRPSWRYKSLRIDPGSPK